MSGTFWRPATTSHRVPNLDPSAERTPTSARAELGEPELVRRAQLGSGAAFEQLVLARGPQLYRYLAVRLVDGCECARRLAGDPHRCVAGATERDGSRFWSWLCGIAAHKAADAARGRSHAPLHDAEAFEPDEDGILDVRAALAALPERYREVLLLRHLLGLTETETADLLDTRVGTVKSRSNRARRALEDLLR